MKRCAIAFSVLLGFWVLISLFLDFRIYGDYTLLVGDRLYYADPTFKEYGGSFFLTSPSNPLMDIDNSLQGYPFRTYVQASFAKGEIPWWNPYIGMGVPFVGLGSGVFDPVAALAGFLASPTKLPNFISVMGLLIASWGMFLFLGTLGASRTARVFGAIAFTFSGWTIVWLGRTNFMAEIWMPWIFWATEHLIRKPAPERIAAVGLFSALICLPAHLQTSLHIFAALGLYVLVRLFQVRPAFRGGLRITLSLALALALGIGVAAIQIVPLADFLAQSDLPSRGRSVREDASWTAMAILRHGIQGDRTLIRDWGPTILTAVSPLFFGSPRHLNYWWHAASFPETTLYVGLLPLFFALYGFSKSKELRGMVVWLILIIFSLGVAYGLPLFNILNYLPGFDQVKNTRLRLVYRFALAAAAALGFDRFTRIAGGTEKRRVGWSAVGFGFAALLLPACGFLWMILSPPARGHTVFSPATVMALAAWAERPACATLLLCGAWLLVWKLNLVRGPWLRGTAILIAFADAFLCFHDFNPTIPSSFAFPTTPVVRFLQDDTSLYRVSSTSQEEVLPPNTKLPYRIFDVDLDSILAFRRYASLQDAVAPPESLSLRAFRFLQPEQSAGLINLLNIKYFIIPHPPTNPDSIRDPFRSLDFYRLPYDREVLIYENTRVLPRAFLVHKAAVLDQPEGILTAVTAANFDPAAVVLLEEPSSPHLPETSEPSSADIAEIHSLNGNTVRVHARTAIPAYLVLSEVYHPGWKATVDGIEKPIYLADYLFRAVYLEAGTHDVLFTFMPRSYQISLKISGTCLVTSLFLLAAGFIRCKVQRHP